MCLMLDQSLCGHSSRVCDISCLIWFLVSDHSGFSDEEKRAGGFALIVSLLLLSSVGRSMFRFSSLWCL